MTGTLREPGRRSGAGRVAESCPRPAIDLQGRSGETTSDRRGPWGEAALVDVAEADSGHVVTVSAAGHTSARTRQLTSQAVEELAHVIDVHRKTSQTPASPLPGLGRARPTA